MKALLFIASGVALVSIVLLFVPMLSVLFNALSLIICLLSGIYSFWFIGISLYEYMLTIKDAADKRRLSTDNSPAPKKR